MTDKNEPIAVIDSGVGGVSVLKELVKIMPNENYIYLGDSKNAPYGTKTKEQVADIIFSNVDFLMNKGIKAIVVACNTATGAAVKPLREKYKDMPIIGIEPAIKPALLGKDNPTVVVMATPLTLKQEKFEALAEKYSSGSNLILLPCPGLMEIVEDGDFEGERIDNYLKNLVKDIDVEKVDSVVLGCTHYPHVRNAIKKVFGKKTEIFDGGEGTAKETKRRLKEMNMLSMSTDKGKVEIINTSGSEYKIKLTERLLWSE